MFIHKFLPRQELERVEVDGRRMYMTPCGPLPSVTTVLSDKKDKTGLEEWKAWCRKIGDNPDHIVKQAQHRGNEIHKMAESYLMNEPTWESGIPFINREYFNDFREYLDKYITTVYGIELPLWSCELKAAGTADVVAEWNHNNIILDYKTSRKQMSLTGDKYKGYKIQATAYAMMVEERYKMKIPFCGIVAFVDHESPQIILFKNEPVRDKVRKIFA